LTRFAGYVKALVRQVTDSGSKSKSEQVAKGKDMISEACRVGIVFLDSQIGFVVKKAIKNMRSAAANQGPRSTPAQQVQDGTQMLQAKPDRNVEAVNSAR